MLKENYGWIDFYHQYFKQLDYHYKVRNYKEFNEEFLYFADKIIVTTDDDPKVPVKLLRRGKNKFVFICHDRKRMQPHHYVPIFPFLGLDLYNNYVMPVFPIDLHKDKYKMSGESAIKILLIGGGYDKTMLLPHKDIEYIWVARHKTVPFAKNYVKAHTFRLMHLIKHCDFILYPCGQSDCEHENGATMSGLLPLAISTCTPILFRTDRVPKILHLTNYIIFDTIDSSLIHKLRTFRYDYDKYKRHRDTIISNNIIHMDSCMELKNILTNSLQYTNIIHFMWICDDPSQIIPERYRSNVQTFKNMNPRAHIIIWNKDRLIKLLTDFNKDFLIFYNNLTTNIQKADFSRYMIVYLFGGLYIDLDFYCVYNLHDLLKDKDVALFYEPKEHAKHVGVDRLVYNGILYSRYPKHPLFLEILRDVIKHFPLRNKLHKDDAMYTTGPMVITEMYNHHPTMKKIVYDSHLVIPVSDRKKFSVEKCRNMSNRSYTYTLWKEGHWDLGNDSAMLHHDLEYYIDNPDDYMRHDDNTNKCIITIISIILCVSIIIIVFFIFIIPIIPSTQ